MTVPAGKKIIYTPFYTGTNQKLNTFRFLISGYEPIDVTPYISNQEEIITQLTRDGMGL